MEKKRVLITGATSGLGREAALQLSSRGWRVAVTGRRRELLEETGRSIRERGGEALLLPGDVCDPAAVRSGYAALKDAWGGLDWALLNAGIGESQSALELDSECFRETLDTNVMGVVRWLEAVLPDMIRAGAGTIAGVSSLAAFRGLPGSGAYCASKAALNALLESARVDLRGTGVRVVTVCPGFVRSEMTGRGDPGKMPFLMETEKGVRAMLKGIERGQAVVSFPWQMSLLVRGFAALLPAWAYDRAVSSRKSR